MALISGISVRPAAQNDMQKLPGKAREPAQVGDAHWTGCKYAEGATTSKSS